MNVFLATDAYKVGHHLQYPKNTTKVYSNFTPRSNKYAPKVCDKVVSFGQQMVMQQIKEMFDDTFFSKDKTEVCGEIKTEYSLLLNCSYDVSHIEALHDLGYLPIKVKSLPEGTLVPMGVPVLTIYNTKEEFYWLTNFLETLISNLLWKPMTSATIAHAYKKKLTDWCLKTDKDAIDFVNFQGHDFSMRGMDSIDATISSGLGHATSFMGSDSLPVIHGARKYYSADNFVIGSVNATEHSVMCAGGSEEGDELATFRHLMKTFPTGILSIVSDTWDLWKVLTEYLPELKEEILDRDGKIVIRPDSGDPVDIICGERDTVNVNASKGVIELLWDLFGGTINKQGYKVLDSHIGAIYGDSITLDRAEEICKRLEAKGFASTNIVLGIGSFTYQYNTRDTFGFAMKATYVEINREGREIFKDPITDDGTKKSAKGLLYVHKEDGDYSLIDQCKWEMEGTGQLITIFEDGKFFNNVSLNEIRNRLAC
jgi:nicotinamide phosphoribosyltransferase